MNRKISDIMQTQVEFVTSETPLKEIGRIIFGYNINGLPVCKGKKVIGFITEKDILSQFTSSEQGENINTALKLTAKDVMNNNPILVQPNVTLKDARDIMFEKKISRLPVVDKNGDLVGIISKGDIFRAIVQKQFAIGEEEEFYDWLSKNYDSLYDWKKRLSAELPSLVKLFKRKKARVIVDIASSTGAHALALAKRGFKVYGLEASILINKIAEQKRSKLSHELHERLILLPGSYGENIKKIQEPIDVALFMGDALSHVICTDEDILKELTNKMNPKKSTLVFQILNYNKIFKVRSGLRDFLVRKPNVHYDKDHLYVGFYSKGQDKRFLQYSVAIFDLVGTRWVCKGINNTTIKNITQKEVEHMLKKNGFTNISFYGSTSSGTVAEYYTEYGKLSFTKPFDPVESDWLVVVAEK